MPGPSGGAEAPVAFQNSSVSSDVPVKPARTLGLVCLLEAVPSRGPTLTCSTRAEP
jgi:hypothetical protein